MLTDTNLDHDLAPKTSDGNRNPVAEGIAKAHAAIDADFAELINAVPTSEQRQEAGVLSGGVRELSATVDRALAAAKQAKEDLDIHPDGRSRRAAEAIENGRRQVAEIGSALEARATILEAQLITSALAEPDSPTALARVKADAETVLRLAPDPAAALERLFSDDDLDIVSIVAGPWGRRLALMLGMKANVFDAHRTMALARIAESHDPRARAAKAAQQMRRVRGAIGATRSLSLQRLS